ncbi:MAG: aminomethyl-transferring glycine dehydrogenase subunit GcvPA [Gammaproteobacteria bacterium]
MSFAPHTEPEIQSMLQTLGLGALDDLFSEIPKSLQINHLNIPEASSELNVSKLLQKRAQKDQYKLNFLGFGAYQHYIPAAVWELAGRGEFLTAYTPYQPEASQGTLQLLYEYQSMMTQLMHMNVSNASLYDGASALAEAVLMALRLDKKEERQAVLIPQSLHPWYLETVQTLTQGLNIQIEMLPFDPKTGQIDLGIASDQLKTQAYAALVLPWPNVFGILEPIHELTNLAHAQGTKIIACVNPMMVAWLSPPGSWGETGADFACGDGQVFGAPLASGGPYFGFLCCKQEYIRQLPGRLVGRTVDLEGKTGFTLTLQAREQHIRRAKANSNICTNQGLLVTAATIYLSLMGSQGLIEVAQQSHANLEYLKSILQQRPYFKDAVCFHECLFQFEVPVEKILKILSKQGIQAGVQHPLFPENTLLICTTEMHSKEELDRFAISINTAMEHI